jgi:hypothetical protein
LKVGFWSYAPLSDDCEMLRGSPGDVNEKNPVDN